MDLSMFAGELVVIVGLALLNGLLSMSEMAMVSARKFRLQQKASEGSSRAKTALALINEPSQFLASIQIGITLIGVFAGAFGGANIAAELERILLDYPLVAAYAPAVSMSIVVMIVTLLSLVLGELVPKRLALGHAETISLIVAKPIKLLSILSQPAVKFLSMLTEGILKLLRYKTPTDEGVTEDEVRMMVEQGTQSGVFEKEEESIINRTFRLSDQAVSEVMTQRLQLVCLDVDDEIDFNIQKIVESHHSFFPVYEESIDKVIGIISVKKLFAFQRVGALTEIRGHLEEPLFVAESMAALKLLEMFKTSGNHFAIVIDEYGGLSGAVTAIDLLESIVGDLPDSRQKQFDNAVQREDGSWLIDGIMNISKLEGLLKFPEKDFLGTEYQTLGGFIMGELGKIPKEGEIVHWKGWSFEVMDMDGNRVDKVLIVLPKVTERDPDEDG
ncbi:MAG: HlyC/CorC family transporter [Proteobacteria bacterium]|nr:MAG: HlyC/CorC family transporter [Pseudomonadota bacterium]